MTFHNNPTLMVNKVFNYFYLLQLWCNHSMVLWSDNFKIIWVNEREGDGKRKQMGGIYLAVGFSVTVFWSKEPTKMNNRS